MAHYIDSEKSLFMDSGNCCEWVTLYIKPKEGDGLGIRLTRPMAYALMKEIEARLFGGDKDNIRLSDTLKENDSDYCFYKEKEITETIKKKRMKVK